MCVCMMKISTFFAGYQRVVELAANIFCYREREWKIMEEEKLFTTYKIN